MLHVGAQWRTVEWIRRRSTAVVYRSVSLEGPVAVRAALGQSRNSTMFDDAMGPVFAALLVGELSSEIID